MAPSTSASFPRARQEFSASIPIFGQARLSSTISAPALASITPYSPRIDVVSGTHGIGNNRDLHFSLNGFYEGNPARLQTVNGYSPRRRAEPRHQCPHLVFRLPAPTRQSFPTGRHGDRLRKTCQATSPQPGGSGARPPELPTGIGRWRHCLATDGTTGAGQKPRTPLRQAGFSPSFKSC